MIACWLVNGAPWAITVDGIGGKKNCEHSRTSHSWYTQWPKTHALTHSHTRTQKKIERERWAQSEENEHNIQLRCCDGTHSPSSSSASSNTKFSDIVRLSDKFFSTLVCQFQCQNGPVLVGANVFGAHLLVYCVSITSGVSFHRPSYSCSVFPLALNRFQNECVL